MRRLVLASALGMLAACTGSDRSEAPRTPELVFTVEDARLGTRTFGPDLTDMKGHWVYEPGTGRTRIHVSGQQGAWRAGIDFAVPLSGPGEYQADQSYRGADRAFSVALADHDSRKRIAFIGADATLVLEPNGDAPDLLSGTFSGRFAVGARTTGTDVLETPPDERTYATIRDGRFRVRWYDSLHGKGRSWPPPRP